MGANLNKLSRHILLSGLAALIIATGFWRTSDPTAQAAVGINSQINFQGKLVNTNGTNIADGIYNIEFKIYQDGDGVPGGGDETLEWTETRLRNNSQGVTVTNGIFQVNLGSVNPFGSGIDWNQDTIWLSINLGNANATCTPFSNCAPDGEMSPMIRFTAAPYALNSENLQGLNKDQFVQLAQGVQTDGSATNASIAINKTGGTANILQLQRGGADVLIINNAGQLTFKPQTDDASALKVQKADGSLTVLDVDTTNNRVGINTAAPTADLSFGPGANRTINVITQTASNTAGNNLTVQAATGNGTGAGGNLVLQAGGGGATDANGGNLYAFGGNKTGSGTDGNVILAHNGTSAVGNVGVGTASPASKLEVTSSIIDASGSAQQITTTLITNNAGTYNQNGLNVTTTSNGADTQSGSVHGISNRLTVTSGEYSGPVRAINNELILSGTVSVQPTIAVGQRTFVDNNDGVSPIDNLYGSQISIEGLANNTYGLDISITPNSSSGNVYGLHVSNSGDSTNMYGLYVNDLAADNTPFGIYQVGTNDYNYFAGNVGIGTTSPTSGRLQIGGLLTNPANNVSGIYSAPVFSYNANSVNSNYAGYFQAQDDNNGNADYGTLAGLYSQGLWNNFTTVTNLYGIDASAAVGPSGSTATNVFAINSQITMGSSNSNNITNAKGLNIAAPSTGTFGTIANNYGIDIASQGTARITNAYGLQIQPQSGATTINAGLVIGEASGGNNTNLLIGTTTVPSGSYSIYNSSTDQNYFAGNVGIGDASPNSLFTVGNNDLFQINSSGQIGAQTAPTSDYLFTLNGSTANDYSRMIDITQANDSAENSTVLTVTNTANAGTVSGARSIYNAELSLTPTATLSSATAANLFIGGIKQNLSLSNITLANTGTSDVNAATAYGNQISITGSPVYNDATLNDSNTLNAYGQHTSVFLTPTLSALAPGSTLNSYGGYFDAVTTTAGSANLQANNYGIYASATGGLTTTGNTAHYGGVFNAGGTADNNYGVYISDITGATNNYALYSSGTANSYFGGNVGIGTPSAGTKLTVQVTNGVNAIDATDGTAHLVLRPASSAVPNVIGVTTLNDLAIITNDTSRIYIQSGGNTGIGTGNVAALSVLGVGGNAAIGSTYATGNGAPANGLLVEGNTGIGQTSVAAKLDILNAGTAPYTNTGLRLQSTFSPSAGGTQTNFTSTVTNAATASANTAIGAMLTVNDSTALANTLQGLNLVINDTGSAAKTVRGLLVDTSGTTNASAGITGALFKGTTTTSFLIQNSSSTELLRADTTNMVLKIDTTGTPTLASARLFTTNAEASGTVRIGNATNGAEFSTAGPVYRGTARPTKKVTLMPEYPGATLTGDGTNNIGTMTSDFCSGTSRLSINNTICAASDERNYYSWTAQATNDYDVYVRYQLPSDFDGWASNSSIQAVGWRTTSNESVTLAVFNSSGTQCGSTTTLNSSNTTWQQTAMTGSETTDTACNTTNMAPGSTILFRIRLTVGSNNNFARAGEIIFDYFSKF
jgi:trimeric autotransporter adhesin